MAFACAYVLAQQADHSSVKNAEKKEQKLDFDYFRKISSKSKHEIPFSYFDSKNESELEEKLNVFDFNTETTRYDLIQELNSFSKEMEAFGLSVKNLPDYMPKHKDSKQMCLSIAKKIIDNKEVYNRLMTKKYFPMKEISKLIDVHPKTVERNREFIICICIIYKNDYENFKGYLKQIY
jgi:RNA polymerase sigma factor